MHMVLFWPMVKNKINHFYDDHGNIYLDSNTNFLLNLLYSKLFIFPLCQAQSYVYDIGSHTLGPCQVSEVVHFFIVLPSLEHHPGYRKFSISTKEYVTPIEKSNAKVLTELRTNHSLEWFLNQFSKSNFQRMCLTGKWQPSRSNTIHSFFKDIIMEV